MDKRSILLAIGMLAVGVAMGWLAGRRPANGENTVSHTSRHLPRHLPETEMPSRPSSNAASESKSAEPQSVDDEIEDFRRVLSSGAGYDAKFAFYEKLKAMTPEAAPKMIGLIAELGAQGYDLDTVSKLFWQRWGEIDGEAACSAIFDIDRRFHETEFSKRAIEAWASKDPAAAEAWLRQQADVPLREGMMKGLLRGMVEADPAMAQQYLATADLTRGQKDLGYHTLARHWLREGGVDAVATWFDSFSADDPNALAVAKTAADVMSSGIVDDALEWSRQLDPNDPRASFVRDRIYARLTQHKPDALVVYMGFVESAPELKNAEELASRGVSQWIRSNPNAMGVWLAENSHLPNYDLVVEPFVRHVAGHDHEAAVAWANTIKDGALRQRLAEQLAGGP